MAFRGTFKLPLSPRKDKGKGRRQDEDTTNTTQTPNTAVSHFRPNQDATELSKDAAIRLHLRRPAELERLGLHHLAVAQRWYNTVNHVELRRLIPDEQRHEIILNEAVFRFLNEHGRQLWPGHPSDREHLRFEYLSQSWSGTYYSLDSGRIDFPEGCGMLPWKLRDFEKNHDRAPTARENLFKTHLGRFMLTYLRDLGMEDLVLVEQSGDAVDILVGTILNAEKGDLDEEKRAARESPPSEHPSIFGFEGDDTYEKLARDVIMEDTPSPTVGLGLGLQNVVFTPSASVYTKQIAASESRSGQDPEVRQRCPACDVLFFSKAVLAKHIQSHERGKMQPYRCHITDCTKGYQDWLSLERHLKRMHRMLVVPVHWHYCRFEGCGYRYSKYQRTNYRNEHLRAQHGVYLTTKEDGMNRYYDQYGMLIAEVLSGQLVKRSSLVPRSIPINPGVLGNDGRSDPLSQKSPVGGKIIEVSKNAASAQTSPTPSSAQWIPTASKSWNRGEMSAFVPPWTEVVVGSPENYDSPMSGTDDEFANDDGDGEVLATSPYEQPLPPPLFTRPTGPIRAVSPGSWLRGLPVAKEGRAPGDHLRSSSQDPFSSERRSNVPGGPQMTPGPLNLSPAAFQSTLHRMSIGRGSPAITTSPDTTTPAETGAMPTLGNTPGVGSHNVVGQPAAKLKKQQPGKKT